MAPLERAPGDPEPRRQARSFGYLLAAIAAGIGLWREWHGHEHTLLWLSAAGVFAAMALWWIEGLLPLTSAWLKLGAVLHAIVNPVMMALLFVLAIVPTGIAMRLAGKDLLRLKRDPKAASYWVPRDSGAVPTGSMKDQF